jgi:hypothetical protein
MASTAQTVLPPTSPLTQRSHPQSMLTRDELSLLRAALAYWSEEIMLHPLPMDAATQDARLGYRRMEPRSVELLYHRLAEHNIQYVVVDTLLNHVVNTRLFKFPPRLQPAGGRWQVRSVIG